MTKKTTIAIMYDFDKTLCTKDMQEYGFIPMVKMKPKAFWAEVTNLAKVNKMDTILAYMYFMLHKAKVQSISVRRKDFVDLGAPLELYPGVDTWFDRIKHHANGLRVKVEHYVISSGLREIIEGSKIYKKFQDVFACEFFYDENGVACWPKNVVNYTTKTQFLFRINKGALDLSENASVNKYVPDEERPIPFRNMIYIGDGPTDVPCMRLVKSHGGFSIAVYKPREKTQINNLLKDGRVNFLTPADYSEKSELEIIVKDIMSQIAFNDTLAKKTQQQLTQTKNKDKQN